jgi:hypothetical protein
MSDKLTEVNEASADAVRGRRKLSNPVNETPAAEAQAPTEPTAIYEIICKEIEIDGLICYRTHRLTLTKARADEIETLQPGTLALRGV